MGICKKCGKEIEDGREFCEACEKTEQMDMDMLDIDNISLDGIDLDSINLDDIDLENIETLQEGTNDDNQILDILSDNPLENEGSDIQENPLEEVDIEKTKEMDNAEDILSMLDTKNQDGNAITEGSEDILDILNMGADENISNSLEEDSEDILGMLDMGESADKTESQEDIDDFSLEDILNGGMNNADTNGESIMKEEPEDSLSVVDTMSDLSMLPEAEEMEEEIPKKKKKSLLSRLFGNVKDEKWEKGKLREEEKKKAIEEKKAKLQEEKQKAAEASESEEVKDKKAEKEAAKKAKKEEKEKAKQAKKEAKEKAKELQAQEEEEEGRINRVGAVIVFVFFGLIMVSVLLGTESFSYRHSIKTAEKHFEAKKYTEAYNEVYGVTLKEKDQALYDKITTVMYVNKELNSFHNYYELEMYPEALDSLLKGLSKYDKYITQAKELEVSDDLNHIRKEIITQLNDTYELSEERAKQLNKISDKETYSKRIIEVANGE